MAHKDTRGCSDHFEEENRPGLSSRNVLLYGDNYPKPRFENRIKQTLASVTPQQDHRLFVESYIARFRLATLSGEL